MDRKGLSASRRIRRGLFHTVNGRVHLGLLCFSLGDLQLLAMHIGSSDTASSLAARHQRGRDDRGRHPRPSRAGLLIVDFA
jgi:hypothetical protein